jgi:hypothetical protein
MPYENDLDMIRYYAQVLLSETVKKSIQPLLYMIAVHHLNAFLFDQTQHEQFDLKKKILKNLRSTSNNEKVRRLTRIKR